MMRFSAAFLALLAVVFGPFATEAQNNNCANANSDDDIMTIICDDDNEEYFGTLCTLLETTGIDGSLPAASGVFTLFAPLNDAFTAAGGRIGVNLPQQQSSLQYHIASQVFLNLQCGDELNTLLYWNTIQQSVEIDCTSGDITGVEGDVILPFSNSGTPMFTGINSLTTSTTPPLIEACNGVIYPINGVLGFDPIQYNWPINQPCSISDPTCVRPTPVYTTTKGGKGYGVVTVEETVGDLTFVSTYPTKAAKKGYNFSPYQTFYANDAYNYFGPWAPGYGYGYGYNYPHYGGKKSKGYGYNYGYGYGGYGYGGYGYYGGKGYRYGWRKNRRRNRRLLNAEVVDEEYETMPVETIGDMEEPASAAGDYYYNYRKQRNLRRGQ